MQNGSWPSGHSVQSDAISHDDPFLSCSCSRAAATSRPTRRSRCRRWRPCAACAGSNRRRRRRTSTKPTMPSSTEAACRRTTAGVTRAAGGARRVAVEQVDEPDRDVADFIAREHGDVAVDREVLGRRARERRVALIDPLGRGLVGTGRAERDLDVLAADDVPHRHGQLIAVPRELVGEDLFGPTESITTGVVDHVGDRVVVALHARLEADVVLALPRERAVADHESGLAELYSRNRPPLKFHDPTRAPRGRADRSCRRRT